MPYYELGGVRPQIADESVWLAPSAEVIGNVRLASQVGIWFGSVLRGDNEPITIGQGTNIQENCVLHTDFGFPCAIGKNCTIGHKAIVHGCTIGDNSLIGMGATVLNGAVIGANCLIGAGALIPEGKHIPAGSLVVGMPGRIVRELDDDTIQSLTHSAEVYIANAKRFAKELKEIKLSTPKSN